MAATTAPQDMDVVTVRIYGARFRLTHNDGSDFVWVYRLDETGSDRTVGYFCGLGTQCPIRRWWGRIPEWRSNLELPLRTLYDDVWQFWASRCPEAARAVTGDE